MSFLGLEFRYFGVFLLKGPMLRGDSDVIGCSRRDCWFWKGLRVGDAGS